MTDWKDTLREYKGKCPSDGEIEAIIYYLEQTIELEKSQSYNAGIMFARRRKSIFNIF